MFAGLFSICSDFFGCCAVVFMSLASFTVCTLPEAPKKNNALEVKKKWTAGELKTGGKVLQVQGIERE